MKTSAVVVLTILAMILFFAFFALCGCSPKRPKFSVGDEVVATVESLEGISLCATGKVLRVELNLEPELKREFFYYKLDFSYLSATNDLPESQRDTCVIPEPFLKRKR